MATLDEKARDFLEKPFAGAATTLRPDGSPHSTVVWVDVDTDVVMFNTAVGRAKERHLRQDPRVSLIVVDPEDAYRWVAVSGTAELRPTAPTTRSTSWRRSTSARTSTRGASPRRSASR